MGRAKRVSSMGQRKPVMSKETHDNKVRARDVWIHRQQATYINI